MRLRCLFLAKDINLSLQFVEVFIVQELFLGEDAEQLVMPRLNRKVDYLSSDDHNEDKMLENVHQIVFLGAIMLRQAYLGKVLLLLDKVMLVCYIPGKGLP